MKDQELLQSIEYLREKADISYEEAANLLEEQNGDVMYVLIEMEKQGRLYTQEYDERVYESQEEEWRKEARKRSEEIRKDASSLWKKASNVRFVVEKRKGNGKRVQVMNANAFVTAGVALFAPHIAVTAAALGWIAGYEPRIEKQGKKDQNNEEE